MSQQTLDIARVRKYLKASGVNIDNDIYTKYFRITDDLIFSFWNFNFVAQPDILQLRNDYSDTEIKSDIALIQLRAMRNKLLSDTDKLVGVDYPLSESQKDTIKAWRQTLRDLPENINTSLLTLDEFGRFDKSLIPPLIY